jgi:hypothetical protein
MSDFIKQFASMMRRSIITDPNQIPFDKALFDSKLAEINWCYEEWLNAHDNPKKPDLALDFHKCCNQEETKKLEKAIKIVINNTPDILFSSGTVNYPLKEQIYHAVILYYYVNMVIEYYVDSNFDNYCFDDTEKEVKDIVYTITKSDEPWASEVRRIIMGFNEVGEFKGGKRRRIRIRTKRRTRISTKKRRQTQNKKYGGMIRTFGTAVKTIGKEYAKDQAQKNNVRKQNSI